MPRAVELIKNQLVALTPEERAEIAHFLLESLDSDEDEGVEDAWETELARRTNEIATGVAKGRPAEQVFADLRRKKP